MRFTGQIRVPDIDHPGVPATFLIEGSQAEVILEGKESLGRWSLYDVHARRLVASAFQVDLDGEEVTFVADEPIDFAYRGVEHMAEVWAKLKSMNLARRTVAVARSRRGTEPSRVEDLRQAMEENLAEAAHTRSGLAGSITASPVDPGITRESVTKEVESLPPAVEPSEEGTQEEGIPVASQPDEVPPPLEKRDESSIPGTSEPAVPEPAVADQSELDRLAAERRAIEEERARLEEQRRQLESQQKEAEQRESDRVEAFRLEMKRLEDERAEYERLERERQAAMREAMERLEAERGEVERQSEAQSKRQTEDAARSAALQEKLEEIERKRLEREREESERVAAARARMEALEEQKKELESLEAAQRAEAEEVERRAEPEDPSRDQQVVDLGEFEEKEPATPTPPAGPEPDAVGDTDDESEPAMASTSQSEKQGGIFNAVRSAFGKGAREHTHDFVDAPGGLGIARSICQECGYVSISTEN